MLCILVNGSVGFVDCWFDGVFNLCMLLFVIDMIGVIDFGVNVY